MHPLAPVSSWSYRPASGLWPGPKSPFCPWPCRCTFTIVASTIAYSMSGCSLTASNKRWNTSALTQSLKRLKPCSTCQTLAAGLARGCLCGQSTALPQRSGGCLCRCAPDHLACQGSAAPSWPIARLSVPIECSCAYCITSIHASQNDSQQTLVRIESRYFVFSLGSDEAGFSVSGNVARF